MKTKRTYILAALMAAITLSASAQQVNTLYFLENAPMRHTINPAFQPVSKGYLSISPLGWMSFSFGNNSLTLSDVLMVDPATGHTITPMHPNGDKEKFLNKLKSVSLVNGEVTMSLLNMGFRIKDKGFLTIGLTERVQFGSTQPKSMMEFWMRGGMTDISGGVNTYDLSKLGFSVTGYTELSGGYSHQLNDQWTIGGKLKFLMGQLYSNLNAKNLAIDATSESWHIRGNMDFDIAGPLNSETVEPLNRWRPA